MISFELEEQLIDIDKLLVEILKQGKKKKAIQRSFRRIRDKHEPIFLKAVEEWFEIVRKQVVKDLNRKVLKAVKPSDFTAKLTSWTSLDDRGREIFKPVVIDIFKESGDLANKVAGIERSFDVYNPHSVKLADELCGKLVREVSDNTRKGIASAIGQGIKEGKSMPVIAKEIKPLIGLTKGQATAVSNYEKFLIEKRPELNAPQVGRRVVKYIEKLHKYRTNLIATTETARAQSEGTLETYGIEGVQKVEFMTAAGCCEICDNLNGHTYGVEEAQGMIPVHPSCRCVWGPVIAPLGIPEIPKIPISPEERIMRTGDIVSSSRLGELKGVNETVKIMIKGDGEAAFKPVSGEQMFIVREVGGELAVRERAAYLISNELGMDNVPLTVIRTFKGAKGSAQLWKKGELGKDVRGIIHTEEAKMDLFDYLIKNDDRHGGNFLVTVEKKYIYIDNGFSLSTKPTPGMTEGWKARIMDNIDVKDFKMFQSNLTKLKSKEFLKKLADEGLEKEAITHLEDRVEEVINLIKLHAQNPRFK